MLRIEKFHDATNRTTVRAAGQLTGPWVRELRRVVGHTFANGLVIDLSEVTFADHDGVRLLRSLVAHVGVSLRCSAFIAAQLGQAQLASIENPRGFQD